MDDHDAGAIIGSMITCAGSSSPSVTTSTLIGPSPVQKLIFIRHFPPGPFDFTQASLVNSPEFFKQIQFPRAWKEEDRDFFLQLLLLWSQPSNPRAQRPHSQQLLTWDQFVLQQELSVFSPEIFTPRVLFAGLPAHVGSILIYQLLMQNFRVRLYSHPTPEMNHFLAKFQESPHFTFFPPPDPAGADLDTSALFSNIDHIIFSIPFPPCDGHFAEFSSLLDKLIEYRARAQSHLSVTLLSALLAGVQSESPCPLVSNVQRIENLIRQASLGNASKTIVRTNILYENLYSLFPPSLVSTAKCFSAPLSIHTEISPVSARSVAYSLYSILTRDPDTFSGRTWSLTGPEALNPSEIVRAISQQTDTSNTQAGSYSFEQCTEREYHDALLAAGVSKDLCVWLIKLYQLLNQPGRYYVLNDVGLQLDRNIINDTFWSHCELSNSLLSP